MAWFKSAAMPHSHALDPEVSSSSSMAAAIVAMAAAIVTIANVVMAAVVEPQRSWS